MVSACNKHKKPRPEAKRGTAHWPVLVGILGLALVLRLAYIGGLRAGSALETVDAIGYHRLAVNLLEYGSFVPDSDSASVLSAIRMPLYPVFIALLLAATNNASTAIPVAQSVVDAATVLLVYGLVRRLASRRSAYFAALLYAINPISIIFVGQALTEIVLAFTITLTLYCFLRTLDAELPRSSTTITGVLAGLCIMCKPNVVLLPLVLSLGVFVHHRRTPRQAFKRASLLVVGALLVLLPWLVRNRLVFGQWFLSLAFQDNLAHVSAVATILKAHGEEVATWTPRWEETYMDHIVAPARDQFGWTDPAELVTAREAVLRRQEMAAVAGKLIRDHPSAFLVSHFQGVVRSFMPSVHRYWYAYFGGGAWPQTEGLWTVAGRAWREGNHKDRSDRLAPLASWWSQHPMPVRYLLASSVILHGLAYVLVGTGLWSLRTQPGALVGLGLTLVYLLLLPGPIAHLRFWVPAVPLATALIACSFWPKERQVRRCNRVADPRGG